MQEEYELEYVGFWARFGATLVDGILECLITFPILTLFYGSDYWISEDFVAGPVDFVMSYVFPPVAVILFWCLKQATPGKMLLSAKIVDAKNGKAPTTGQLVLRYFAYFISIIPLCLGFVWVAFDSKKQGWPDKIAGTVVVRPRKHTEDVKFEK